MKTRASIEAALAELARLGTQARTLTAGSGGDLLQAIECENMLTVARLICQASLCREETRGCFWRLDFPEPDNAKWPRNVCQWQGDDGDACCETRPVVMTRLAQPTQPRIGAGCFSYLPSTT
jgi:L-aspartate oxidase